MAVDSKFFNIPFGATGDRATIPEATQPSGAVSYQQGFGPDYERDPATDPLAKRVPRDETNEYIYQITNAVKYLQWFGLPQYTSVADGGPTNYPLTARVRYDAGAGMQAWVSLVATNTAVPGSDATKWALDDAFNLATLEATLTEALAGVLGTRIITPRRLASSVQRGQWNVATAAGTANVVTAALSPAPAALTAGFTVAIKWAADNTAAVTLNLNGLGALPIVHDDGGDLAPGDLINTAISKLVYDTTRWILVGNARGRLLKTRYFTTPGTFTYTPTSGTRFIEVEVVGAGGAGGGTPATSSGSVSAGAGGASGAYARATLVSGFSGASIVVGAGGNYSTGGAGGNGGQSSFGTVIAGGGGGGTVGLLIAPGTPLVGGSSTTPTASGGDLNVPGNVGGLGNYFNQPRAGDGAQSYFGGRGIGANATSLSGTDGSAGSGGGGGASIGPAAIQRGGNGGAGLVVIKEYA